MLIETVHIYLFVYQPYLTLILTKLSLKFTEAQMISTMQYVVTHLTKCGFVQLKQLKSKNSIKLKVQMK